MKRLTMSRYPLALICGFPWSEAAPEWKERPSGREARVGTVTHRWSDAYLKSTPQNQVVPDLGSFSADEIADGTALFEGSLRGWLASHRWAHSELGIRYDAERDEATIVAGRGAHGYDDADDGPMVMRGTLDLVAFWRDDRERLCIDNVDIKTGQPRNAHREQLHVQDVAVSRLFDPHLVRSGFVFPRKTKVIEPEWETLDRVRLDEVAGRIRKTLRLLPKAEPVPGDHCSYRCPLGRGSCPAWVEQQHDELEAAGFFK
jgi:hypothetical protein